MTAVKSLGLVKILQQFSHISAVVMVLLAFKQTSEPSPKLIIVVPGVNANNGGRVVLLLHQVAIQHSNTTTGGISGLVKISRI